MCSINMCVCLCVGMCDPDNPGHILSVNGPQRMRGDFQAEANDVVLLKLQLELLHVLIVGCTKRHAPCASSGETLRSASATCCRKSGS